MDAKQQATVVCPLLLHPPFLRNYGNSVPAVAQPARRVEAGGCLAELLFAALTCLKKHLV